ncbi:tRNA isopentenyltransferase [Neoconidiobolus thromboides FSU 785]|nr:tRNA isopentenyltransferase [Neoconidiobolus thromboides FSU 785]
MNLNKRVIAIFGTTGVGKTKLSIELAKRYNGEIINVDVMQMYKGFDIITNKATLKERDLIPHHMMDFVSIEEEYDIQQFENDALKKIDMLHSKNKIPILVGGTHYYFQSLLWENNIINKNSLPLSNSLSPSSTIPIEDISKLKTHWSTLDNRSLYTELEKVDPEIAVQWHYNDRRRVLRGLEIYHSMNQKQSELLKSQKEKKKLRFNTLVFWTFSEKNELDKRLDDRVDSMVKEGLINEMNELYNCLNKLPSDIGEYDRGIKQAIGFKAFDPYFQLLKQQKEEKEQFEVELQKVTLSCLEVMKQQTRKYAKKQINFIKNKLMLLIKNSVQNQEAIFPRLLNATDLNQWDKNVLNRAIELCDKILIQNNTFIELDTEFQSLFNNCENNSYIKFENWKKRVCESCSLRIDKTTGSLVEPVIINGDQEWEAHLKSKMHRKQKDFNKYKALVKLD